LSPKARQIAMLLDHCNHALGDHTTIQSPRAIITITVGLYDLTATILG
jgi:hypothetical protein